MDYNSIYDKLNEPKNFKVVSFETTHNNLDYDIEKVHNMVKFILDEHGKMYNDFDISKSVTKAMAPVIHVIMYK